MLPILTPAESAELDRQSSRRGVTVDVLMENAGRAAARAAVRAIGGSYGRRAVVVCGKGNNGGDGLVAARHLDRWGLGVAVVLLAEPSSLRGEAGENFRRLAASGVAWRSFSPELLARELARADVALDAIFGTGFRGSPRGPAGEAIALLNAGEAAVVAVDIPSGVDGESGAVPGPAVRAELTVTFGAYKPGLVFHPGAGHAGLVEVADIGFPPDLIRSELLMVEASDMAPLVPARDPDTHKRSTGVVLVVAGSRSMSGAAVLTASAAYRAGAGLVTVAAPGSMLPVLQGLLMEATYLPLAETEGGTASEEAWPSLQERLATVHSAAFGPGLTTDPSTAALVRRCVAECPVPFVLDADGLNAFAGRASELAERRADAVLTPHAGEFGRLVGLSAGEVAEDRVAHVRKAAAESGCTILLKGARTIVVGPEGPVTVNPTGGAALATGGTGDVLTGAIAAFLARGLAPTDAAALGAYIHGAAGQLAGAEHGEGTVASDLLARIPEVLTALRRATV